MSVNGGLMMIERTGLMLLLGLCCVVSICSADESAVFQDSVLVRHSMAYMEALERAVDAVLEDLDAAGEANDLRIAVLPLGNDFESRGNELVRQKMTRKYDVFVRKDSEWDALLKEIEQGQRWSDIMDPATVQKFGNIQGVSAVVSGKITDVGFMEGNVVGLRLSLNLYQVETGAHVWGAQQVGKSEPLPEPPPPQEPGWMKMFWMGHKLLLTILGCVIFGPLFFYFIVLRLWWACTTPR